MQRQSMFLGHSRKVAPFPLNVYVAVGVCQKAVSLPIHCQKSDFRFMGNRYRGVAGCG